MATNMVGPQLGIIYNKVRTNFSTCVHLRQFDDFFQDGHFVVLA